MRTKLALDLLNDRLFRIGNCSGRMRLPDVFKDCLKREVPLNAFDNFPDRLPSLNLKAALSRSPEIDFAPNRIAAAHRWKRNIPVGVNFTPLVRDGGVECVLRVGTYRYLLMFTSVIGIASSVALNRRCISASHASSARN